MAILELCKIVRKNFWFKAKLAIVLAISVASTVAKADRPGFVDPDFYIFLNIFDDLRKLDCFLEFFQERRLPTGFMCEDIENYLKHSMLSAGLPMTDAVIKDIERKVMIRMRDAAGRASGRIK